jgi:hypothetical protein
VKEEQENSGSSKSLDSNNTKEKVWIDQPVPVFA